MKKTLITAVLVGTLAFSACGGSDTPALREQTKERVVDAFNASPQDERNTICSSYITEGPDQMVTLIEDKMNEFTAEDVAILTGTGTTNTVRPGYDVRGILDALKVVCA